MSENPAETNPSSDQENQSALFANLVLQQANMATMLMGKGPKVEGAVKDLEAARLFIDQLEMLEAKTKGNLTHEESTLLKQTLMGLQLAFVQAVDSAGEKPEEKPKAQAPAAEPKAETKPGTQAPPSDESHKKFTKKY